MVTALRQATSPSTLRFVLAERPGLPVIAASALTLAVLGVLVLSLRASLALAAVLVLGSAVNVLVSNKPLTPMVAGFLGLVHLGGAVVLTLF